MMTNLCAMQSVSLVMSPLLNARSKWPNASRRLGDCDVAKRVDAVNCKLPAPCLDRTEQNASLGNNRWLDLNMVNCFCNAFTFTF